MRIDDYESSQCINCIDSIIKDCLRDMDAAASRVNKEIDIDGGLSVHSDAAGNHPVMGRVRYICR